MKRKKKGIISALVISTCIIMILATIPVENVIAGSFNQAIDDPGYQRETKHPAVDAIDDDVYSTYTAKDTANNVFQIFLSTSSDTGRNWGPIGWVGQRMHWGQFNEQDFSDVFVDQVTGIVHIVWQELCPYNNNWVIMYTFYDPATSTWRQFDVRLTPGNNYNAYYPKVAVDGPIGDVLNRIIHVCWQDDSAGVFEVRYTESPDGGVTWTNRIDIISENDNAPSIHPVIEVDFDDNGFPAMEYVNFAWEQDNSGSGSPNQIYIWYGIYNPYDEPALRYEGLMNPSSRTQTHPDICADLDEVHFVWWEDTPDPSDPWYLGNVWIAHDSFGFDNTPPNPAALNPVEVYMVTSPGQLANDLVDGDSWGPAVDHDDYILGPGNYLAVAYTAYEDPQSSNTELFCDPFYGSGANYVYTPPPVIPETATPTIYEHYPDVAVEPGNCQVFGPDTYAHIVYDRQSTFGIPPFPWSVWYIREP
jgi:hypothetical protein